MTKPTDERTPLEQLRIDRDWSYQRLADEIERATGVRRNFTVWRKIALGDTTQPHARTADALDRFMAAQGASR